MQVITKSLLLVMGLFVCSQLQAQQKDYYYEQSTRYGTFRHYSNGGSKLISGRDYEAEMAQSQQEARSLQAERQRQRQAEYERMRKAQYPATNSNQNAAPKNYGPTPADLALQQQKEKDRFYLQYEELLEKAKDLSGQALILSEMNRLRPSDTTALRLFGVYAELAREEGMNKLYESFSPAFLKANEDIIRAGYGSESYRNGSYDYALISLNQIKTPDLNSFTQNLCSRLRLQKWDEIPVFFEKYRSNFAELAPIADSLAIAFKTLKGGQIGIPQTKALAATLYHFAVTRRENGVMDFVNILALDAAVSLEPENSAYREERFNSNSILKLKYAMQEDYDFFNK